MENDINKELQTLKKQLKEVKALLTELTDRPHPILGKWISEDDLKKLLKRGTTWFWEMRKKGKLEYTKLGCETYYSVESLQHLLEENKTKAYRP